VLGGARKARMLADGVEDAQQMEIHRSLNVRGSPIVSQRRGGVTAIRGR
jgi:hypothetical protein